MFDNIWSLEKAPKLIAVRMRMEMVTIAKQSIDLKIKKSLFHVMIADYMITGHQFLAWGPTGLPASVCPTWNS